MSRCPANQETSRRIASKKVSFWDDKMGICTSKPRRGGAVRHRSEKPREGHAQHSVRLVFGSEETLYPVWAPGLAPEKVARVGLGGPATNHLLRMWLEMVGVLGYSFE